MASERDNKETADVAETEAPDSDDKTKTLNLINLFPAIILFP